MDAESPNIHPIQYFAYLLKKIQLEQRKAAIEALADPKGGQIGKNKPLVRKTKAGRYHIFLSTTK